MAMPEVSGRFVADALPASEERYRDLYEEAPHAYFSVGADACIRRANRQAVALLGYALDDLIGRPVFSLYADTPTGRARAQDIWRQFQAGQEVRGAEVEMLRADGAHIWGSLSVTPIRDAQGAIGATRSMVVDITARKQPEASLRTSEVPLTQIIATSLDAILTVDAKHRIVLFNAAAEQMFRCAAAEALGQPLARFCTAALHAYLCAPAQDGNAACAAWIPEGFHARRADGMVFPIEGTFSQTALPGQLLSTIILRDVQPRKQAEASLCPSRWEHRYLHEELNASHNSEEIIGTSAALQRVLQQVAQVARTDATILITGETGTGKELIVRALHHQSARRHHPLIKVNCTALPPGLIESELFGHEKGAFTGALARRIGRFELAEGGTLFLDEIGDVPPGDPGQALAGATISRLRAAGDFSHAQQRCADHCRHEPRSATGRGSASIPGRSLLLSACLPDSSAAASRTSGRYPAFDQVFRGPI
jgi:PAS domain S-box-containing protein